MKFLLIATLLMSTAFADDAKKEKTLEEIKTMSLANIDQRMSALQSHKSCVQGASTKEAMKGCFKAHKEAMDKLHTENRTKKNEWKEMRKSKKKKS